MNKSLERMRTTAGKRVLKQALRHDPEKESYHGIHIENGKQIFHNGGFALYSLTDYVQGLPEVNCTDLLQRYIDKAEQEKSYEITLPKLEEVEAFIEQAKAGAKADGTTIRKEPDRLGYWIEFEKNRYILVNAEYLRDVLIIIPTGKAYVARRWGIYLEDNFNNQVYLCGCYHTRGY